MAIKQNDSVTSGSKKKRGSISRHHANNMPESELMLKLLDYKGFTPDVHHFIVLKDSSDGYVEMLTIRGQNVDSMGRNQQVHMISGFQDYLRAYLEDQKIIISPFPANTTKQQAFQSASYAAVMNRLKSTRDARKQQQLRTRLRYINDQLQRNIQVEHELDNLEYILLLFGKTITRLNDLKSNARNWGNQSIVIEEMEQEQKEQVLFRINNMNTRLR